MAEVNIVIVGGGSFNWTPKLLIDLALMPSLKGQITLVQGANHSCRHRSPDPRGDAGTG